MKFRKKGVIEAKCYHGRQSLDELSAWCGDRLKYYEPCLWVFVNEDEYKGYWHRILPGDWIVEAELNGFKPCRPELFEEEYESVS